MNARTWWQQRQPRERLLLAGGGVVLAALLLWLLVWEPLTNSRQRLEAQAAYRSGTLAELQRIDQQLLPAQTTQATSRDPGTSLLRLADDTVRAAGLAGALRRIEPQDNGQVRLWLEGGAFDTTISWLQELSAQHGITLSELHVERAGSSGLVNARLTLADQPG